ncbi:MAG: hypothetical protein CFH41_02544 [Alphaproteobacteria bacterium MarineAlpha11_Bin1]|nr:MAG: hypothetical protein CFH41_02544 [Alphaproteobacteria bacterium MarineAlpha11_Bin1]
MARTEINQPSGRIMQRVLTLPELIGIVVNSTFDISEVTLISERRSHMINSDG